MDRVEDVMLHQKLLARARDPENRPVFHIRFLEVLPVVDLLFLLAFSLKFNKIFTFSSSSKVLIVITFFFWFNFFVRQDQV
jgi:hypothetical protein